jgi:hypothetical protein
MGAATAPPPWAPTGSSSTTMIDTTGFEAGAYPANEATYLVFE